MAAIGPIEKKRRKSEKQKKVFAFWNFFVILFPDPVDRLPAN